MTTRATGTAPVLEVKDLHIGFWTDQGVVHAVQSASWVVGRGETLSIVGESGSGKTATALSVMDLLPPNGRILGGTLEWMGEPTTLAALRRLRGSRIGMIFQNPMSSLDPLSTVGRQISEVLRRHRSMSAGQARARAIELLELVGISEPKRRYRQYAFELSGGMAQRVMIATALASEPDLLIADEPTTALDVTIQAQILELIASLQRGLGISVLLITHDLGVVAQVADRVAVMYGGRVVEQGPTADVLARPLHPYTGGLIAATPNSRGSGAPLTPIPGSPPTLTDLVDSCTFAARCPRVSEVCRTRLPELTTASAGATNTGTPAPDPLRKVACWHVE
jgi:oligopeptide/dipeptide ABC transporter ATP-binding protein